MAKSVINVEQKSVRIGVERKIGYPTRPNFHLEWSLRAHCGNAAQVVRKGWERRKRDIHHNTVLFHLDQRPVCFPPIQVDRFRQVIHGFSKEHYRLLRSPPTLSPARLTPFPPRGGFAFWRELPPLPDLISPLSRTFEVPKF
ncbi:hypothetical protein AVEN_65392-1 [Araneus ventricosus]|uniref:Uncharacterized protein n=1 Tax=Araneus ventricosus TaxID=182803 RepID=A0A4Y2NK85_ARAVE|nr:hypothetical protein AVEN_21673-1 [Araneus ventricosus]GBN39042.1 hypothetical protein AVEN_65392-1 [Araneus ventricosus]